MHFRQQTALQLPRFHRHKHITDRYMDRGHKCLRSLCCKRQPTRRGFEFRYTYIEAAPHTIRQALPSLLPGHPQITPPRSPCNLQNAELFQAPRLYSMSASCHSHVDYGALVDCNRRLVMLISSVTRAGSKSIVLNPCASAFRYFMTFVRKL